MAVQIMHEVPTHSFPRSCFNEDGRPKRIYPNSFVADLQAWRMEEYLGQPMRAYRCLRCGSWHVGHRRDVEAGR